MVFRCFFVHSHALLYVRLNLSFAQQLNKQSLTGAFKESTQRQIELPDYEPTT